METKNKQNYFESNSNCSKSHAYWLARRQQDLPLAQKDFSYIDLYQKAYKYAKFGQQKTEGLHWLREAEACRDHNTQTFKQLNHLIQIDKTPNTELKEARWEIYKISVNFRPSTFLNYDLTTKT